MGWMCRPTAATCSYQLTNWYTVALTNVHFPFSFTNWTMILKGRSFWMISSPSCKKEVRVLARNPHYIKEQMRVLNGIQVLYPEDNFKTTRCFLNTQGMCCVLHVIEIPLQYELQFRVFTHVMWLWLNLLPTPLEFLKINFLFLCVGRVLCFTEHLEFH